VYEETPPVLLVCIGLDTGYIYCMRGDIARERISRVRLTVDPSSSDSQQPSTAASPVTGLGFRAEGSLLQLFAVSTSSINLFDMHEQPPQKHVLDQLGAEGQCVAMSDNQVSFKNRVCAWCCVRSTFDLMCLLQYMHFRWLIELSCINILTLHCWCVVGPCCGADRGSVFL
jgi:hypothetical protein